MIHFIEKLSHRRPVLIPARLHTRDGENAEDDRKEPNEKNRNNESRQRIADDRADLHADVPSAASVDGTEDPERNGDSECEDRREDVDENGVFHRFFDHVGNRLAPCERVAEISL